MSNFTTNENLRDFLTVAEAAQVLGVSPDTLRRWDRAGKVKAVRHPVNSYRLYRRSELEALLQGLTGRPVTPLHTDHKTLN